MLACNRLAVTSPAVRWTPVITRARGLERLKARDEPMKDRTEVGGAYSLVGPIANDVRKFHGKNLHGRNEPAA